MRNLRILTVVTALFYLALGTGMAFVTLRLEELGASYTQISLVVSLQMASALLANTVYSRYADRLGARRRWMFVGLMLLAIGYLSLGLAPSLGFAALGRVFEGVGGAIFATTSLALMGHLLKDSPTRGRTMGFVRGFGSFTFAFGALGGGLLAGRMGIHATFLVGVVLFVLAGLVTLLLEPGARPRPGLTSAIEEVAKAVRPLASEPGGRRRSSLPWVFLTGVVIIMMAHTASTTFFPNYLLSLDRDVTFVGSLWAFTAALEFPMMMGMGALADRWGRGLLLAVGAWLIATVNLIYVGATRLPMGVIFAQVLRAPGVSSYMVNGMAYTAERSSDADRGLNSGVFNLAQSAGQLVGVLAGGLVVQWFGFRTLYVGAVILALIAGVAFFRLRKAKEPTPEAAAA